MVFGGLFVGFTISHKTTVRFGILTENYTLALPRSRWWGEMVRDDESTSP